MALYPGRTIALHLVVIDAVRIGQEQLVTHQTGGHNHVPVQKTTLFLALRH